jgi:glycosyltransferase involved in cell wall biosynthesis
MKLVFYASKFPPLAGGAGIHAYYLGKDLSLEGHKVFVVCEHARGLKKFEKLNENYYVYRTEVPVIKNRGTGLYFMTLCTRIAMQGIKVIREVDPDILHFHDAATGVAGLITRQFIRNKPTVFNFGGSMIYEYMCNANEEKTWNPALGENYAWEHPVGMAKYLFQVEKRFYLKNDRVYTAAKYQEEMLIRHLGMQYPKARTIHNGIDTNFLQKNNFPDVKKELGYEHMIYVGVRLVKYKAVDVLIKASLPILEKYNVHLVIAGDGPEEAKLKELAGASKRIHFLGNLDWETNVKYVSSADMFVLPTLVDKTPNCLMEALSLQTPSIASDIDGVKELIPKGGGILISPGDPDLLREKIEWILNHPREAAEMGAIARKFMIDEFDWSLTYKKVKEIYQELLENRAQKVV